MTTSLAESLGGHTPIEWAQDFLTAANFPLTPSNYQVVYSWEYAESGGGGGMFNPLNTTQGGYAGETDFNSVGVKNYVRYEDGISANSKVIHNGYYPAVVDSFQAGNDAARTRDAIAASPWGTGHFNLLQVPGQPEPTPTPTQQGENMLIPSPHKPYIKGRVCSAKWSPAFPDVVVCENGGRIRFDQPFGPVFNPATGHGGATLWKPVDAEGNSVVPAGHHGQGIFPTIDSHGRPDGRGIVMLFDGSLTYIGEWS